MASFADEPTETKHGSTKPPLSSHPAFPAVVALWFAVLLGVGSLLLPLGPVESIIAMTGIEGFVPALAAPLGTKAHVAIALVFALVGGYAGSRIARFVQQQHGAISGPVNPFVRGLRKPVDAPSELAGSGILTEVDPDALDRAMGADALEAPLFSEIDEADDAWAEDAADSAYSGENRATDDRPFPLRAREILPEPQVFDVSEAQILHDDEREGFIADIEPLEDDAEIWDDATFTQNAATWGDSPIDARLPADPSAAEQLIEDHPEPANADFESGILPDIDWLDDGAAITGEHDSTAPLAAANPPSDGPEEEPRSQASADTGLLASAAARAAPSPVHGDDLHVLLGQMQDTLERYRAWKAARAVVALRTYPRAVDVAPDALEAPEYETEEVAFADDTANRPAPNPVVIEEAVAPDPDPAMPEGEPGYAVDEADFVDQIFGATHAPQVEIAESEAERAIDPDQPAARTFTEDATIDAVFGALPAAFGEAEAEPLDTDEPAPVALDQEPASALPAAFPVPAAGHAIDDHVEVAFEEALYEEDPAEEAFTTDVDDIDPAILAPLPAELSEADGQENDPLSEIADLLPPHAHEAAPVLGEMSRPFFDLDPAAAGAGEEEEEYDELTESLVLPIHRRDAPRVTFGDMASELIAEYENGYEDEEEEEEEEDTSYGSLLSMPSKYTAPPSAETQDNEMVEARSYDDPEALPSHPAPAAQGNPASLVLVQKGQAARAPSLDAVSASSMRAEEVAETSPEEQQAALREALLHLQRMNGAA